MPYAISYECISCDGCVEVCPVEAIHDGPEHKEINTSECIECGDCTKACPIGAVYKTDRKSVV